MLAAMATWDAAAGVWVGERAAGTLEVPDPLWIFGYGSLCWKSDFPFEASFVGSVQGWGRFFAQRSTDHRGTPEFPGLVATLLKDEQLRALSLKTAGSPASRTVGVCYRVGKQDAETVLDALDFREKGGYTREIIEVYPQGSPGTAGNDEHVQPVRALLYSATPDNPGFDPKALSDLPSAAATIGSAHGPSGPNREYLERLALWLKEVDEPDEHIEALVGLLSAP